MRITRKMIEALRSADANGVILAHDNTLWGLDRHGLADRKFHGAPYGVITDAGRAALTAHDSN